MSTVAIPQRVPVLEILDAGLGVSLQDQGRTGWKRFGVPPGGALDDHARRWANVLVGNPPARPVLEILLSGARFRVLSRTLVVLTGATASGPGLRWQTRMVEEGEILECPSPTTGVWSYLACRGGFEGRRWFGSVSIFPRGGLGQPLAKGEILLGATSGLPQGSPSPGTRWLDPKLTRDYSQPPPLRVWPGPQWDLLGEATCAGFLAASWQVSSRSDRTGYRLEGPAQPTQIRDLASEPVLPGTIQMPPDGQPIVTMRDGPTVGGYPKLGVLDPEDLSWFAQCRPGQSVRFVKCPGAA